MLFKDIVLDSASKKYQEMFTGDTDSPYSIKPTLDSTLSYESKREKYHARLRAEAEAFNSALSKAKQVRERRWENERYERQRKENRKYDVAKKKFRIWQIIKTIVFCLPSVICILIGVDVFNPNDGRIATINATENFSLGWAIALFVIFCLLSLFTALFPTIKMFVDEEFNGVKDIDNQVRYNVAAIIVAILSIGVVAANLSQVAIHFSDYKLIYSGGDIVINEYVNKGDSINLPSEYAKAEISYDDYLSKFVLIGWEIDGKTYEPGEQYVPDGKKNIKAVFREDRSCKVTIYCTGYSVVTISYDGTSETVRRNGSEAKVFEEYITYGTMITVSYTHSGNGDRYARINGVDFDSPYTFELNEHTSIDCLSQDDGCLVEGTLITMSDGTNKRVEDLCIGDEVIVFNHELGRFESAPILVNVHAQKEVQLYNVIHLYFSDGNILKIVDEHGLYDKGLNQYVYITEENANNYIGHRFVAVNYENNSITTKEVVLVDVQVVPELTTIYNPASVWHINLVSNNMLTLSAGMVNLFPYGEDMKYDVDTMTAAIEKYGLYTYDDFRGLVSEEVFEMFPFKYYKVAVGQGLFTFEDIVKLIKYYNESIVG